MDTANLDRMVVEQSDAAYILADSSKFNKTRSVTYSRFQPKHVIVTDDRVDQKTIDIAKENDLLLHIV